MADLGGTGQGDGSALGALAKAGAVTKRASAVRVLEGSSINKSLSSLGKVITQLSSKRRSSDASESRAAIFPFV
jgi:hypothetical protein